MLSNQEAAAICTALNHKPAGLETLRPNKHRFHCGCGYVSTNRQTRQLAVQAGIHHMRKVALEAQKNGFQLPRSERVAENVAAVG